MTDSFLLLDDASSFLLIDDANSFLIIGTEDDSGGIPYVRYANVEYALAKERERIKQEEIIRLRLEAQELLMRERELADKRDKQSRRQLAALEKEKASLMADIQYQLVALEKLQKITVQRKNRVIMLLLTAACPFNNLTIANNKRMI